MEIPLLDLPPFSLKLIVEYLMTAFVDIVVLALIIALLVALFFTMLNRRDLRREDRAYRKELRPGDELRKFIHRGATEDERIDVKRSLRAYRQQVDPSGVEEGSSADEGSVASTEIASPEPDEPAGPGEPRAKRGESDEES